jgi:hypothetical protein
MPLILPHSSHRSRTMPAGCNVRMKRPGAGYPGAAFEPDDIERNTKAYEHAFQMLQLTNRTVP